jgi:uncharacterized membrane-anchored protein
MKRIAILGAVVFQVAVLGFMAGEREYIVRNGRTVYLRTAPVDPRDIFRGDYVALRYEINSIDEKLLRDGLSGGVAWDSRGLPVYTLLTEHEGVAEAMYTTDRKPDGGLFIAGRIHWPMGRGITVRYGIESFYLEQGSGKELERLLPARGGKTRLEMQVRIGSGGQAVLTGYRVAP